LPLIELPARWVVTVDVLAWLVIHLGVACGMTRLPAARFSPHGRLLRIRRWERDGRLYETVFRVRAWKDLLPDGAALFRGGFRKRTLRSSSPDYLARFVRETCRGELTHWIVLCCAPLFFLWNPWWVGLIMIAYASVANLPCVLVQRYNRIRLERAIDATLRKQGAVGASTSSNRSTRRSGPSPIIPRR